MKKLTVSATALLLIIFSLIITACHKPQMTDYGCYVNMEEAGKVAASKKKDILILAVLNEEDSATSDFLSKIVYAPDFSEDFIKKYVVVHMDLSQGINSYASLLNISMVPSVYLLSKEQYYLDSFAVTEEFTDYNFFKYYFDTIQPSLNNTKELIASTKKGRSLAKLNAINELYDSTPADYRTLLAPVLKNAFKLDKKNETGLCGKMLYAYIDAAAVKALSLGNVEETVKLYLSLEKETRVDANLRQQAIYTAAYICAMTRIKPVPVIIEYLQKAIDVNPEGNEVPGIKKVMQTLQESN